MNFNDQEFDAFERDFARATQELCSKYQLKIKKTRISYSAVDFDMKVTFEKDEEGVNSERIKFEIECFHYGFAPDDYLRIFVCNGIEYELIGFDRSARKYNCIAREIVTGEKVKMNEKYVHRLLKNEISQEPKKVPLNVLSEEELSMLRLKLGKSKRNQKDMAMIRAAFENKDVFSFTAPKDCGIFCERGVASEDNVLLVFTTREAAKTYLNQLGALGKIEGKITVHAVSVNDVIGIANDTHRNILFDRTTDKNKLYYCYNVSSKEISTTLDV